MGHPALSRRETMGIRHGRLYLRIVIVLIFWVKRRRRR
jgi:hypothetical protein